MADLPVLVAGGGLAGLATAIGLADCGQEIRLLERAPAFTEVGAGLQVGPNAIRALRQLNAWETVEPHTFRPPAIHIRDGHTGKLMHEIRLGKQFEDRFGESYTVAHRADLHAALIDEARRRSSIELSTGNEVCAIGTHNSPVTVNTTAGQELRGGCLIGADGIHSFVRTRILGGPAPQPLPYRIFRMLAPLPSAAMGIAIDCVNLWLCGGGHVVHYPVSRNRLNLVAVTDASSHFQELRTASALSRVLDAMGQAADWPALYLPKLPFWYKGAVCVTGDASHGTVPFLAQGAAMAFEDAATLKHVFAGHSTWPERFAVFENLRKDRVARIDKASRRMAAAYHMRGLPAAIRNVMLQTLTQTRALNRLAWIYQ